MTSTIVKALDLVQSLDSQVDEKSELHNKTDDETGLVDAAKKPASGRHLEDTKKSSTNGILSIESLEEHSVEKKSAVDGPESAKEPSLSNPKLGNPISHSQVIELSKALKTQGLFPRSLDILLRGAGIYVAPPLPKPEPTSEYKNLMARLRREEEARSYERMTNPPSMETFAQRFPMSSAAHAFPPYQKPDPDDEITYAEVNRQVTLIFNVLVSVVACAGAIWVAARWWSTPARLALSMSGSLIVGVAEVVVYGGYIRRLSEAKGKEKGVQEVREVLRTWVIGGGEEAGRKESDKSALIEKKEDPEDVKVRRRKKEIL